MKELYSCARTPREWTLVHRMPRTARSDDWLAHEPEHDPACLAAMLCLDQPIDRQHEPDGRDAFTLSDGTRASLSGLG